MPAVLRERLVASRGWLATSVSIVAAAAALTWVAGLNRAPLVFPDTIAYATAALKGEVPGVFSVFYGLFILPLHLGLSLWPVVLAQGLLMAHLIYLVARCLLPRLGLLEYALVVALLCIVSPLPWVSGQIMPDMFTGVVVLGVFLLVFCRTRLRAPELIYVAVLTAAAITTHLSHLLIAAGLVVLSLSVRFAFERDAGDLVRAACLLGLILIAAFSALVTANWLASGQPRMARNSNVFLLAKLLDEGPAQRYLAVACPSKPYRLCAYLDELRGMTHDDLKWGADSPFKKIGSFDDLEPEAAEIVAGTLRYDPRHIIARALIDTGRQLFRFSTGEGLTPDTIDLVATPVGEVFGPGVERSLRVSRQGTGSLPTDWFNHLHLGATILAALVIVVAIIGWRARLNVRLASFLVFLPAAFICNAVVTGGLAGPYDRYFARLIFLACFAAGLVMLQLYRSRSAGAVAGLPAVPGSGV